jgi:hypothetical protein
MVLFGWLLGEDRSLRRSFIEMQIFDRIWKEVVACSEALVSQTNLLLVDSILLLAS